MYTYIINMCAYLYLFDNTKVVHKVYISFVFPNTAIGMKKNCRFANLSFNIFIHMAPLSFLEVSTHEKNDNFDASFPNLCS